jgi:hypothetical protein
VFKENSFDGAVQQHLNTIPEALRGIQLERSELMDAGEAGHTEYPRGANANHQPTRSAAYNRNVFEPTGTTGITPA